MLKIPWRDGVTDEEVLGGGGGNRGKTTISTNYKKIKGVGHRHRRW